jgi:hypothetical protein
VAQLLSPTAEGEEEDMFSTPVGSPERSALPEAAASQQADPMPTPPPTVEVTAAAEAIEEAARDAEASEGVGGSAAVEVILAVLGEDVAVALTVAAAPAKAATPVASAVAAPATEATPVASAVAAPATEATPVASAVAAPATEATPVASAVAAPAAEAAGAAVDAAAAEPAPPPSAAELAAQLQSPPAEVVGGGGAEAEAEAEFRTPRAARPVVEEAERSAPPAVEPEGLGTPPAGTVATSGGGPSVVSLAHAAVSAKERMRLAFAKAKSQHVVRVTPARPTPARNTTQVRAPLANPTVKSHSTVKAKSQHVVRVTPTPARRMSAACERALTESSRAGSNHFGSGCCNPSAPLTDSPLLPRSGARRCASWASWWIWPRRCPHRRRQRRRPPS